MSTRQWQLIFTISHVCVLTHRHLTTDVNTSHKWSYFIVYCRYDKRLHIVSHTQ